MQKLETLTLFLSLLAVAVQGQSQPPSPGSKQQNATATLKAESRLVLVDVVVRHHREAVRGLTSADFILLEDGKPQKIAFFETHEHSQPVPVQADESSVPSDFTNSAAEVPASVNVILFDTLNTPIYDQSYARQQMIQFLKTLPPGYHVALFELGARLRMLTGFSQTSEELMIAAKKLVPHISPLLETDEDVDDDQNRATSAARGLRQFNSAFFDAMNDFMTQNSAAIRRNRIRLTLQELNELTAAMSGFHGRKNVIWLSEYFPVSFGLLSDNGRFSELRNYGDLLQGTSSTLSAAQVALYPIDVRGLTSAFGNVGAIMNIEARHVGMDDIAEQTGGHAYYNTNDLKFAMRRSLESGSDYYTLAYVPPNGSDSKYHRIDVRFTRSGLSSEHRKGYFAVPIKLSVSPATDFAAAVQPATPLLNGLHLKAHLQLPGPQAPNIRVECTINPEDVTFVDQPNNRKFLRLHLLTVTWDKYLNTVAKASNTLELGFSPEQYARALRDGITTRQEMRLTKPGRYDIRMAVMDDANHRIGSLEIPFEIPNERKLAKK